MRVLGQLGVGVGMGEDRVDRRTERSCCSWRMVMEGQGRGAVGEMSKGLVNHSFIQQM